MMVTMSCDSCHNFRTRSCLQDSFFNFLSPSAQPLRPGHACLWELLWSSELNRCAVGSGGWSYAVGGVGEMGTIGCTSTWNPLLLSKPHIPTSCVLKGCILGKQNIEPLLSG